MEQEQITTTTSAQQADNQLTQQIYDNIGDGGLWPTIIAIIIISVGLILEMGTFFGFMIPADLLLYTSGLILGANHRWWSALAMFIIAIIATVVGDLLGYYLSNKVGVALYDKPDTRYFKKKHLYSAQAVLEKYGDKIFYIAKFLHIRSFLPILAGVGKMNIIRFGLNSILSTTIWVSATFIPSFLIGALFPGLINTWWMLVVGFLIFIGTEAVAWFVLFNKDLKHIAHRLRESHQQFSAIKSNIVEIKDNIKDVAEYVIKGEQEHNNKNPTDNAVR